jgi:hypothetical protein
MVVKKLLLLLAVLLCCISMVKAGYHTIECYRRFFANSKDIEAGIELWLKEHPEYHNYDEYEKLLRSLAIKQNLYLHPKTDSIHYSLKQQNYTVEMFERKLYIIYEPQQKVYFPIMILNPVGYVVGCDVCVMNIVLNDGRSAGFGMLTRKEQSKALKNFERQILPQIKKYIKKHKALQKGEQ